MKPWEDRPLWWKAHIGPHAAVYAEAARIIGRKGCSAVEFWDSAVNLPYDRQRFESAVLDLTLTGKRGRGRYELTAAARRVMSVILGPAPDDPERERPPHLTSAQEVRQRETIMHTGLPAPTPDLPAKEPQRKRPGRKKG